MDKPTQPHLRMRSSCGTRLYVNRASGAKASAEGLKNVIVSLFAFALCIVTAICGVVQTSSEAQAVSDETSRQAEVVVLSETPEAETIVAETALNSVVLADELESDTLLSVEASEGLVPEVLPCPEPCTVFELEETLPTDEAAAADAYILTDYERDVVERVVMAESGGEDQEGQRLVAQCILNAAEMYDLRPDEIVLEKVQYAKPYKKDVSESVKEAVRQVFDEGYRSTEEAVWLFYAPAVCYSDFHENHCTFVLEHGGHRFFK